MKLQPGQPLSVELDWGAGDTEPVGRLVYTRGRVAFEFSPAFLASPKPLSPFHLPVRPGVISSSEPGLFEGLHGVFADSLPDGWGRLLVDRRARQLDIPPEQLTPVDRLACVGSSGLGALTYHPVAGLWPESDNAPDLDALARDSKEVLDGAASELLDELGRLGGSPGGARPKILVGLSAENDIRSGEGALPKDYVPWMVKFAGKEDPEDIAAIEHAYMAIARMAGVDVPENRLISGRSGRPYFAVARYDRTRLSRMHQHSAAGLLMADPRLPSLDYEDLIRATRRLTRDQRDVEEMFRRAVFNALAHNRDDHARQFSFLMDRRGDWRLAPAYDLTFSVGPGGEHMTSFKGEGRHIQRDHIEALADIAGLDKRACSDIVEAVQAAISNWQQYARDAGVRASTIRSIKESLDATQKAARR